MGGDQRFVDPAGRVDGSEQVLGRGAVMLLHVRPRRVVRDRDLVPAEAVLLAQGQDDELVLGQDQLRELPDLRVDG